MDRRRSKSDRQRQARLPAPFVVAVALAVVLAACGDAPRPPTPRVAAVGSAVDSPAAPSPSAAALPAASLPAGSQPAGSLSPAQPVAPSAAPTTAPSPSPASTPAVTIGDAVTVAGRELHTVVRAEPWPVAASSGRRPITVEVRIRALVDGVPFDASYYRLTDESGHTTAPRVPGRAPSLTYGELSSAGDEVVGWVTFEPAAGGPFRLV
ncbi:MAG: hypothetical protein ACJ77N_15960, partial [Chloroflexota bacterium]